VVCASAGNLGQALAWSGRSRGLDVTVAASRFAPAAKLDRIRALGAWLELVDGDFDVARERAAAVARYDGIRLVEDSLDIEQQRRPGRLSPLDRCGSHRQVLRMPFGAGQLHLT
jgi:threonine dehydratase